ncbi:unnamed protein product, partial [marine sediment metagenome]
LEVYDLLETYYYDFPEDKDILIDGAIEGMIYSLGDPHTTYFDLEEMERFMNSMDESYIGIGVSITNVYGHHIIESVLENSPAEQSLLMPGDEIYEVDGVEVL